MKVFFGFCVVLLLKSTIGGIGGGIIDNTDNNLHLTGDNMKQKLLPSMVATVPDKDALTAGTPVRLMFHVYENDPTFEYSDYRSTAKVNYDTCHLINTKEYMDNSNRQISSGCLLTRMDAVTPNPQTEISRTFELEVPNLNILTTGLKDCGVYVVGALATPTVPENIVSAVRCQRHKGHDYDFDIIFTMVFPVADVIVLTKDTGNIAVGVPPTLNVYRYWKVDFRMIESQNVLNTYPAEAPTTALSTGYYIVPNADTVNLGDTFFFELSFGIDAPSGLKIYLSETGSSPVGAYAHSCTLDYTYATDTGDVNVPASNTYFLGPDGCSTGVYGVHMGPNNGGYAWRYARSGIAGTTLAIDKKTSENVMRSRMFELGLPAALKGGNADFKVTCQIGYCMSFSDPRCFYIENDAESAVPLTEPTCSRRKRAAAEEETYPDTWQQEATFNFVVKLEDDDILTSDRLEEPEIACLEKTTVYAVSSVLGILLLVVFAFALAMFVKIRSYPDGGSSVESFHNKGYN